MSGLSKGSLLGINVSPELIKSSWKAVKPQQMRKNLVQVTVILV